MVSAAGFVVAETSATHPMLRGRLDPERERTPTDLPDEATRLPDGVTNIAIDGEGSGPIRKITFLGTEVPQKVAAAAEPYIGAPLKRETLQTLTSAMSDAYAKTDVALFTLVIPDQDFAGGEVRILVAEGHIDAIKLTGDLTRSERVFIEKAVADLKEKQPTDRGDLDRTLLLLNDVPGLDVKSQIRKSRAANAVTLDLEAEQTRFDASVGYDSRTTQLIDQGQVSAKLAGYGVFRAGDSTQLDLASSTDFEDFRYVGLEHDTPLGSNGTRAGFGVARLESVVEDTGISGDATLYAVNLTHPFVRSKKHNLRGLLAVDALDSRNAAFGSLVATERTRAVRTAVSYDRNDTDSYAGVSLKLSQGLEVWDAQTSQPVDELAFFKAEANVKTVFRFAERSFVRANAAAQWSEDALPANERFSVGGANYGRAFETGLINADKGAAVSLETAYRPFSSGKFASSEIYTFADYAVVDFIDRPIDDIDLGSAGLGVRANYDSNFELGLEASRPFNLLIPDFEDDWQFAVSWRVKFDPYAD